MHGLAGPVDAPVEPDIAVCTVRALAAADILTGQVDRVALEIEHREIIIAAIGGQETRCHGTLAARQRPVKTRTAVRIRHGRGKDLVGVCDQLHLDTGLRHRGLQRAHHEIDTIRTAIGRQRQIGDHEPAFGAGRNVIVSRFAVFAYRNEVGAGREGSDGFGDRENSRHRRIRRASGFHAALPDLFADGVRALLFGNPVVFALGRVEAGRDGAEGQRPVSDPPDFEFDRIDIHRLDGQTIGITAGQDHAVAGNANKGRAVAEIDLDGFVHQQGITIRGWQALAQCQALAVTEGQTADTQRAPRCRQGDRALRRHGDIGFVVGVGIERMREAEADLRRVTIDADRIAQECEVRGRLGRSARRIGGSSLQLRSG